MNWNEDAYLALTQHVVENGYASPSRAGNTISLPGQQLTLDLRLGFPLLTTRKIFTQGVFGELAAFVRGAELLSTYKHYGCNYWDENAAAWPPNKGLPKDEWRVGKIYGALWRDFNGVDQLANVIESIKSDPYSRRHVVSAWDCKADGALPPCHIMFQFYVRQSNLSCHVYMRSVDLCVGLPSDILLYATLLSLVAKDTQLTPAELTFSFGDAHVYENHLETWETQYLREAFDAPTVVLSANASTLTFEPGDIQVLNYEHHPALKYEFNA